MLRQALYRYQHQLRHQLQTSSLSTAPFQPPAPADRPFLHHGRRLRNRHHTKFHSPRKRANLLLHQLTQEVIQTSTAEKPNVFQTDFRVGDAIEIEQVEQGGKHSTKRLEKIRGVVLGIFRKGIDHSVLIRDVVYGEPVEYGVPLHSPLVKSVKVLEKNFVKKGKKKIKRAKLYYLRDRNDSGKCRYYWFFIVFLIFPPLFSSCVRSRNACYQVVTARRGYRSLLGRLPVSKCYVFILFSLTT